MKCLLTGCNGFIAKNLVSYFSDYDITGVDIYRIPNFLDNVMVQDVSDYIDGCYDLIIHAASGFINDVDMFKANYLGTKRCIEVASRTKCPLLFVSSAEASQPVRTYGIMKLAGECLVSTYKNAYIVRPYHIYGPKMNLEDGRIQSEIIKALKNKTILIMRGNGLAIRSFTHVADLLNAFRIIIEKGTPGIVYEISNEFEATSIISLCESLNLSFTIGAEEHPIKSSIGNSALLRDLGWSPIINTADGFLTASMTYR